MSTNQQRRDAAKRKLQRQNERRAKRANARRDRLIIVGLVLAVIAITGVIWYFASGNKDEATRAANVDAAASQQTGNGGDGAAAGDAYSTVDPAATDAPDAPDADSAASGTPTDTGAGDATCSYPASGSPAKSVTAPTNLTPVNEGIIDATIALGSGNVTVALDRAAAPCTVNSFVSLAEQHYFDATTCHRLTSSPSLSVLQCGDPTGTGTGGPGYSFADELSGTETYGAGTLAMANAGPNTNGSQFFIVYADSQLPPSYTVFGTVTAGLDVVQDIAAKGTTNGGQDGSPVDPITIESVTVS